MVKVKVTQEKISSRKYIPSVIEPSFGIGRILYALIEHSFWTRPEDSQRKVFLNLWLR
jgi:glycyl-tRNA synthetase